MNIQNYLLYYRKISENQFVTTSNIKANLVDILRNYSIQTYNYIIVGLYSGSIYIPIESNPNDPQSIFIQQIYNFNIPSNLIFKNMYLLCNYIYLDREERKKFYENNQKHIRMTASFLPWCLAYPAIFPVVDCL